MPVVSLEDVEVVATSDDGDQYLSNGLVINEAGKVVGRWDPALEPLADEGDDGQRQASEPEPDDDDLATFLPDPDDEEGWRRLYEESNKRIQRIGRGRRSAGELFSFAGRPYPYDRKLGELQQEFRGRMQSLARQMREGGITPAQWDQLSRAAIVSNVTDAYRIGVAQARGIAPSKIKPTADDARAISATVKEQLDYFAKFRNTVRDQLATDKTLTAAVDARAALYAGSAKAASQQAKANASPADRKLRWVRHKDDSCQTCLSMEGKIKSASEWAKSDVLPAKNVQCHGNCGCALEVA